MIDFARERWAPLMIGVGVGAAAWLWFARPALESSWRAEAEVGRLGAEAGAARAMAEDAAARGPALDPGAFVFGGGGPTGAQDRMHEIASGSGVTIIRLDPERAGGEESVGPYRYRRGALTVEAEGAYADVASFLSRLREEPMAAVEEFSFSTSKRNGMTGLTARVRVGAVSRADRAVAEGALE